MSPKASEREATIAFVPAMQWECQRALRDLCTHAKTLMIGLLPGAVWEQSVWRVTGGRILDFGGRTLRTANLNFAFPPKLGRAPLVGEFADAIKILVVLRHHKGCQNGSDHFRFISTFGYIAHFAITSHLPLFALTFAVLDQAMAGIDQDYAESTAYSMKVQVKEIATLLSEKRLAPALYGYRRKLTRPDGSSGIKAQRLDVVDVGETTSAKMVDPAVYFLLACLYERVPCDHPSRDFILLLLLLACLGARFSEVQTMPCQLVGRGSDGVPFVLLFDKKSNHKKGYTLLQERYLISNTVSVVERVLIELKERLAPLRETAAAMRKAHGPDLRWLQKIKRQWFDSEELARVGLPDMVGNTLGRARLAELGIPVTHPARGKWLITSAGVAQYCKSLYHEQLIQSVRVAADQRLYFPEDLLFLRHLYVGGKRHLRLPYLVQPLSIGMLQGWLGRSLPEIALEFAPELSTKLDFTSKKFRHTLNTLLDEGGLPQLMQAEWFFRSHPRENKPYQHTPTVVKVIEVREALLKGAAQGQLAETLAIVPVDRREAYLKARVTAVLDTGPGICVHNHSQVPCPRILECHSDCDDLVYLRPEDPTSEEIKRAWAMLMVNLSYAKTRALRFSVDWLNLQEIKRTHLERRLAELGVALFDPVAYMEQWNDDQVQ